MPTVTGLSVADSLLTGGATVTITGTSLANASAVMFGTRPGTIISNSSTQIVVVNPAECAGAVAVTVTTPGDLSDIFRRSVRLHAAGNH